MKKVVKPWMMVLPVLIVALVLLFPVLQERYYSNYYLVIGPGVPEEQIVSVDGDGTTYTHSAEYNKIIYSNTPLEKEELEFYEYRFWLRVPEIPEEEDLWVECKVMDKWYRTGLPYDFSFQEVPKYSINTEDDVESWLNIRAVDGKRPFRKGEYRLIHRLGEEKYRAVYFQLELRGEENGKEPKNFIRDYVALKPGVPEGQVIEREDCTFEIVKITFTSPILEPGIVTNLHDRYELIYEFTNHGEEDIRIGVDEQVEYQVEGEWYLSQVEGFGTLPVGSPWRTLKPGEVDQGLVGIGRVIDPENFLEPTDCFWKGKYRVLKNIGGTQYIPLYFELE